MPYITSKNIRIQLKLCFDSRLVIASNSGSENAGSIPGKGRNQRSEVKENDFTGLDTRSEQNNVHWDIPSIQEIWRKPDRHAKMQVHHGCRRRVGLGGVAISEPLVRT